MLFSGKIPSYIAEKLTEVLAPTWCRTIGSKRTKKKNEENNNNNRFVIRRSILPCPVSSTSRRSRGTGYQISVSHHYPSPPPPPFAIICDCYAGLPVFAFCDYLLFRFSRYSLNNFQVPVSGYEYFLELHIGLLDFQIDLML